MDFASFQQQIKKLSALIDADDFMPDMIIGIARGGWMPALLLSRIFNVKKLCSYGLTYADEARTVIAPYQDIVVPPEAHKILLVEDFLESGKCIKYAADKLSSNKRDIRTAAIGYLTKTIVIPTYSLGQIEKIPPMPWDTQ